MKTQPTPTDLQIFLHSPTGDISTLNNVNINTKIHDLKAQIELQIGILAEIQNIFYSNKKLEDRKTLSQHKLKNGVVLRVKIKEESLQQIYIHSINNDITQLFKAGIEFIPLDEDGTEYETDSTNAWNKFVPLRAFQALYAASLKGNLAMINELLKRSAVTIKMTSKHGRNALHVAAYHGDLKCVSLLLTEGVDYRVDDGYGYTPLALAAQNGHLKCEKRIWLFEWNMEVLNEGDKKPYDDGDDIEDVAEDYRDKYNRASQNTLLLPMIHQTENSISKTEKKQKIKSATFFPPISSNPCSAPPISSNPYSAHLSKLPSPDEDEKIPYIFLKNNEEISRKKPVRNQTWMRNTLSSEKKQISQDRELKCRDQSPTDLDATLFTEDRSILEYKINTAKHVEFTPCSVDPRLSISNQTTFDKDLVERPSERVQQERPSERVQQERPSERVQQERPSERVQQERKRIPKSRSKSTERRTIRKGEIIDVVQLENIIATKEDTSIITDEKKLHKDNKRASSIIGNGLLMKEPLLNKEKIDNKVSTIFPSIEAFPCKEKNAETLLRGKVDLNSKTEVEKKNSTESLLIVEDLYNVYNTNEDHIDNGDKLKSEDKLKNESTQDKTLTQIDYNSITVDNKLNHSLPKPYVFEDIEKSLPKLYVIEDMGNRIDEVSDSKKMSKSTVTSNEKSYTQSLIEESVEHEEIDKDEEIKTETADEKPIKTQNENENLVYNEEQKDENHDNNIDTVISQNDTRQKLSDKNAVPSPKRVIAIKIDLSDQTETESHEVSVVKVIYSESQNLPKNYTNQIIKEEENEATGEEVISEDSLRVQSELWRPDSSLSSMTTTTTKSSPVRKITFDNWLSNKKRNRKSNFSIRKKHRPISSVSMVVTEKENKDLKKRLVREEWILKKKRQKIKKIKNENNGNTNSKRCFSENACTFEIWLEKKKASYKEKENKAMNPTKKKNQKLKFGMSFDEWKKWKKEKENKAKTKQIHEDNQKDENSNKLKNNSFEKWLAKKKELNKTELAVKATLTEQKNLKEQWKINSRLKDPHQRTFEEWYLEKKYNTKLEKKYQRYEDTTSGKRQRRKTHPADNQLIYDMWLNNKLKQELKEEKEKLKQLRKKGNAFFDDYTSDSSISTSS